MIDNGSPEPEFHTDDDRTHFLTVLPANMEAYEDEIETPIINDTDKNERVNAPENAPENLSALQFEIIELIKADKGITYQDIANKTSKNRTTIMRNIAVLKKLGLIKRIGPAKGGHWEVGS
jgi:ATP-dependent DNA helicase RecG